MTRLGSLVVVGLIIFLIMVGCESPVAPSMSLTVNPASVHMKVGDARVFNVAMIGVSDYSFSVKPITAQEFFDIRRVSSGVEVRYIGSSGIGPSNDVVLDFTWYCYATCHTPVNIFLTN